MTEDRLFAWGEGKLDDNKLSDKEVRWLQKRVFKAIAKKMLERPDVVTFAEHQTLQ